MIATHASEYVLPITLIVWFSFISDFFFTIHLGLVNYFSLVPFWIGPAAKFDYQNFPWSCQYHLVNDARHTVFR